MSERGTHLLQLQRQSHVQVSGPGNVEDRRKFLAVLRSIGLREQDRSWNLSPISLEPESLTGNAGPTLEKGQMGPRTAAPRPRTHRRHK
jgi:hypothetical protein